MKFLLIAGLAESLIVFRAPLIAALQARGCEVHVAAPDLSNDPALVKQLEDMGLCVHEVPLRRTGMNLFADIKTFLALFLLMRRLGLTCVLGYTIKPVIYGSMAAWMAGVPHRFAMITGLGYAFQGDGSRSLLRGLVQRLYSMALSRVKKVFFSESG